MLLELSDIFSVFKSIWEKKLTMLPAKFFPDLYTPKIGVALYISSLSPMRDVGTFCSELSSLKL